MRERQTESESLVDALHNGGRAEQHERHVEAPVINSTQRPQPRVLTDVLVDAGNVQTRNVIALQR